MVDEHEDMLPGCKVEFGSMHAKLDGISKAVIGNGDTKDSLIGRVASLEGRSTGTSQAWIVVGIVAAIAAAIIGIIR